jgi:hypothetical protein
MGRATRRSLLSMPPSVRLYLLEVMGLV